MEAPQNPPSNRNDKKRVVTLERVLAINSITVSALFDTLVQNGFQFLSSIGRTALQNGTFFIALVIGSSFTERHNGVISGRNEDSRYKNHQGSHI